MNNAKHNKNKSNKGFYIALGLCLVAIGAAAWLTYGNVPIANKTEPKSPVSSQSEEDVRATEKTVSGVTQDTSSAVSSNSSSKVASSKSTTSKNTELVHDADVSVSESSESGKIVYPVGKEVSKSFSPDNPVYSVTLNDWRVHNGTDFKAAKGTVVKAITDGNVSEIIDDDMFGKTVVIQHSGGFEARYCGLGDTVLVKIGDTVTPGKEIGSTKSVPCECLEEDHLHLEIKKDGNYINPMDILQKAS